MFGGTGGHGGRAGCRVRELDWGATPLGPVEAWPVELKSAVNWVLDSQFPMALAWGPDLITIHNDSFAPILGAKPCAIGRSFRDVWHEAWHRIGPIAERALGGEATYIEDFPLEIERFGEPETAWFTFCYSPLRLADGSVAGMIDTVVETTASVRAREQGEVLRAELVHRLKNMMAMVAAIAARTLKDVQPRESVHAFERRLAALAGAQDLLAGHGVGTAPLRGLIDSLLEMHGDRFDLGGPGLELGSKAALSLSMVLHELATNASKYGALSVAGGRVALRWHIEPGARGDELMLCWREYGGPPVKPPQRNGFGSRLIDLGLGSRSKVERRYLPGGLEVDIHSPVALLADS